MPKSGGGKKWVFWGCGGCLGLLILAGIFVGVLVVFVFGVIKESDVYQTAFKRAQASSEVQAAIGVPIEEGFMVTGSVKTVNGNGTADINFPISGPKGEATVSAQGTSQPGGPWVYSVIQVRVTSTGQVIDLTNAP